MHDEGLGPATDQATSLRLHAAVWNDFPLHLMTKSKFLLMRTSSVWVRAPLNLKPPPPFPPSNPPPSQNGWTLSFLSLPEAAAYSQASLSLSLYGIHSTSRSKGNPSSSPPPLSPPTPSCPVSAGSENTERQQLYIHTFAMSTDWLIDWLLSILATYYCTSLRDGPAHTTVCVPHSGMDLLTQLYVYLTQGWTCSHNCMCTSLRDGPAHTTVCAATLNNTQSVSQGPICLASCGVTWRQNSQIKLAISPSHSVLTLGQPIPVLIPTCQTPGRAAPTVAIVGHPLTWQGEHENRPHTSSSQGRRPTTKPPRPHTTWESWQACLQKHCKKWQSRAPQYPLPEGQ